jgi:hypothetical protein
MGTKRMIIGLALVGLLAACTTQGDGTTDEPIGSAPMGSAEASGPVMGEASPACEEAFAPLVDMEIASLSDLGDLQAEVAPTIESCESVADWVAGAQQVVDAEINPSTAELLLGIQCNDPSLSNAPVCEDLAAS